MSRWVPGIRLIARSNILLHSRKRILLGGFDLPEHVHSACNIIDGQYKYITDLLALDNCRPLAPIVMSGNMESPGAAKWKENLKAHPDKRFATWVVRGFQEGFRVGFNYESHECRPARRNMRSASRQKDVVTGYLQRERELKRVIDAPSGISSVQISPFGMIPKPHQPGKWRLIVDLSSPRGKSVNDGIDPLLCSLSYARLDDSVLRVLEAGTGALLAKLDIESAYRMIPVHPDYRGLLGMRWQGSVCLDAALPFGLRSAPRIFSAVADALLWIMFRNGITWGIHYLDDFLFCGTPDSNECARNLDVALYTCKVLGVPVAINKLEAPTTSLTFLGIEIDTVKGQLRLPADKLGRLKDMLASWVTRRSCTKRGLLSLIGYLHHAAAVVKPGRVFLRRLIDLSKIPEKLHHFVRLNKEALSDIQWWKAFVGRWNGIGLLSARGQVQPSVVVQSDASGRWGCGAVWRDQWIQRQWSTATAVLGIAVKEAIPVVLAAFTWGRHWAGMHVLFEVDNSTVASALQSGSCRDPMVMRTLRLLHFVAAEYQFSYSSRHILGACNCLADAISRNQSVTAFSMQPLLAPEPCPIPSSLSGLVEDFSLDWTSESWTKRFLGCFPQV